MSTKTVYNYFGKDNSGCFSIVVGTEQQMWDFVANAIDGYQWGDVDENSSDMSVVSRVLRTNASRKDKQSLFDDFASLAESEFGHEHKIAEFKI